MALYTASIYVSAPKKQPVMYYNPSPALRPCQCARKDSESTWIITGWAEFSFSWRVLCLKELLLPVGLFSGLQELTLRSCALQLSHLLS